MARACWLCVVLAFGCGPHPGPPGDSGTPSDAGEADAGDAGGDASVDAGDSGSDAGVDGGADAGDSGVDAGVPDSGCRDPDAGLSPNLLLNYGFECGNPIADWSYSSSASLLAELA